MELAHIERERLPHECSTKRELTRGCGMLGENLLAGIGASVDRAKGMALLDKACKGGVDRACKKLAEEKAR